MENKNTSDDITTNFTNYIKPNYALNSINLESVKNIIRKNQNFNTTMSIQNLSKNILESSYEKTEENSFEIFYNGFESIVLNSISNDTFEFGYISQTSRLILEYFSNTTEYTNKALQKLFLDNFDKPKILIGILDSLSYIDFDLIKDNLLSLAINGISHSNNEVVEYSINCFEYWRNEHSLKHLRHITGRKKWMNDYVSKIIKEIEGELNYE